MEKQNTNINTFDIVGISIRTSNEDGKGAIEIGELWARFMKENIIDKISSRVNDDIYAVYTNYEKDHTKPYTTILGCKVKNLNKIPDGMVSTSVTAGKYAKFSPKGDITNGMVADAWAKIWKMNLNRIYTTDFEQYGKNARNPKSAQIDIFIAI